MAEQENKEIPWDGGQPPDGWQSAMDSKSLSSPRVVSDLVSSFCHDVKGLMDQFAAEEIDNDELASAIKKRCRRMSDLFEGKVAGWNITTWHTARLNGLRSKCTALLHSIKVNYGTDANFDPDHPVAGLFYLLSMHVIEAYGKSHGAEEPPDTHAISGAMKYIIGVLVGAPKQSEPS